jgi:hypothetical protein
MKGVISNKLNSIDSQSLNHSIAIQPSAFIDNSISFVSFLLKIHDKEIRLSHSSQTDLLVRSVQFDYSFKIDGSFPLTTTVLQTQKLPSSIGVSSAVWIGVGLGVFAFLVFVSLLISCFIVRSHTTDHTTNVVFDADTEVGEESLMGFESSLEAFGDLDLSNIGGFWDPPMGLGFAHEFEETTWIREIENGCETHMISSKR